MRSGNVCASIGCVARSVGCDTQRLPGVYRTVAFAPGRAMRTARATAALSPRSVATMASSPCGGGRFRAVTSTVSASRSERPAEIRGHTFDIR